jgi:NTE family protein
MLASALLLGCASLVVVDTKPLPQAKLEPPGSETISADGYRIDAVTRVRQLPDLIILVAMSGGGKRSAAYAYGALKGMRQIAIPGPGGGRSLLSELDGISGISGGSFTAAYYGLYRDRMFGQYEKDFLYSDTNAYIFGIYLLPWNWAWIADPTVGTNDYMERVYDRTMFHGATYQELAALGRPIIAIGATDISYGVPFLFTQEAFDLICSDLSQFPLARAVAASNGFPGLFSPVTLTNRATDCGGRSPGWERRVTAEQRRDPLSRIGTQAKLTDRYLDPDQTRYVHLADGGISDNLGLRVAGSMMENLAQSPEAIKRQGYDHLRRVLVISVDGQGAQDTSVAQHKIVGGLFSLLGLVSGGQIDRYNFETLSTVTSQLRTVVHAIQVARCSEGKLVDDTPCDDVLGELVHISLAAMPDSAEKSQLLAIPTGLSLQPHDVDQLVAAGEAAVTGSVPLREFFADYPPRPTQAPGRAAVQKALPRS